jgi:hypothetical protein
VARARGKCHCSTLPAVTTAEMVTYAYYEIDQDPSRAERGLEIDDIRESDPKIGW